MPIPSVLYSAQRPAVAAVTTSHVFRQLSALELLERENGAAGQRLQEVVARGELLLQRIQEALHDIAQSQLDTQLLLAGQRTEP